MRSRFLGPALVLISCCAAPHQALSPRPSPAADSLIAQFMETPLVAVAERHRSRQVHDFLLELLSHPEFPDRVNDIVVEFGSGYYQPIIDRYVYGEPVSHSELQEVWRGTGQWLVWDSPLYEHFFAAVRKRNATLPAERRIRVLLGDPPIHWAEVRSAEDYRRFADRDAYFAGIVEREVLAKGHRALLIIGSVHLQKRGPLDSSISRMSPGVGEILAQRHPGKLFVVWTLPQSRESAATLGMDSVRSFVRLRGSNLEHDSFARLAPRGVSLRRVTGPDTSWVPMGQVAWPPMSEVVDGLLYLGSDSSTVDADPAIYRDPAYQAELRRRAAILRQVYGFDFLSELEQLLKQSR